MHLSGAGARKVCFEDLNKNIFLEVQNETSLLGYIAYGVHLCNKILIVQGKPENRPVYHPTLSESMH